MSMELEIPPGLTELLQDFTVQVLREKPDDILDFAASYFMKMKLKEKRSRDGKTKGKSKGVSFNRNDSGGSDMEDHGSSSDDEPMGKLFVVCDMQAAASFPCLFKVIERSF